MNKGFTLVELIAVIALLSILVIITTPAYNSISKNIKTKNYESKQNTIEKQTLAYVEKYLKDKVYDGENKTLCFSVNYLIQNGIISSDSDKEEYIQNDITNKQFKDETIYVAVSYDIDTLKLKAQLPDNTDVLSVSCNINY
ncbi:MAG: prepilin-type N-terminal cleavage/methylation domain-containing protein [Bacilli bacterium]|nr:prepilin-type N-terminal cleavage/methylation domain-containing protein [Bacilli bacterium]